MSYLILLCAPIAVIVVTMLSPGARSTTVHALNTATDRIRSIVTERIEEFPQSSSLSMSYQALSRRVGAYLLRATASVLEHQNEQ